MLVCCRELYVYQGFSVTSTLDGGSSTKYFWTRWKNFVKLSYEQQRCDSQYIVELMNNIRLRTFCYRMNTFIKTFLFLTERDVIASTVTDATFFVIHPSSSSFITWSTKTHHLFIHPAKDFYIKTTAEVCVVNNNILSQLRETVQHYELHYEQSTNYNTVTVTTRYDMWLPTSPKNVTTFLSSAENWNFFFITNTYPTCIFYHFKTLPKLLLPTSIYLPSK